MSTETFKSETECSPENPQSVGKRSKEQPNAQNLAKKLAEDEQGGTTLEWALLLVVVGIPAYYIIMMLLASLTGYYRMMTLINSLPFP